MNYQETLDYLAAIPPFVPRRTAPGEDLFNLDNIRVLLAHLGNPERRLRFVHVAGTNGKGSTCAFLQQILTAGGYRTGLYTSPALLRLSERIRVDENEISPESLANLTTRVRSVCDEMQTCGEGSPSEFEIVTAMAFLYFLQERCDIVVLETGLGGRLDATNIIPAPLLAVVTSISLEHTEVLGDTIAQVAREKAGILKTGSELLMFPQVPESDAVFSELARRLAIPLHRAVMPSGVDSCSLEGQTFSLPAAEERTSAGCPADAKRRAAGNPLVEEHTAAGCLADAKLQAAGNPLAEEHTDAGCQANADFPARTTFRIRLLAPYQTKNAALAVQAARLLRRHGFSLPENVIAEGLLRTKWPGRFELLRQNPCVIVDGSHNPAGAVSLRESLQQYFPQKKIYFITGVLADKRFEQMMEPVLPLAHKFFTIAPESPRALAAEKLAAYLRSRGADAEICAGSEDALKKALAAASNDDVICAFGSLYSVGRIRSQFT